MTNPIYQVIIEHLNQNGIKATPSSPAFIDIPLTNLYIVQDKYKPNQIVIGHLGNKNTYLDIQDPELLNKITKHIKTTTRLKTHLWPTQSSKPSTTTSKPPAQTSSPPT